MIKVKRLTSSPLDMNTYILEKDGKSVLVDAGSPWEEIYENLKETILCSVLLTHGHADHIITLEEISRYYPQVPLYTHQQEEIYFRDASWNLSYALRMGKKSWNVPLSFLEDGEGFSLLGLEWKVIHTPGHTLGSLCFYQEEEKLLFSGDVLFSSAIGRTDFPGGDTASLQRSLSRILSLPSDTQVFPGHGRTTTISQEKIENPFLT